MRLSRVSISIKLNTQQPVLRDDLWWKAFDMFIGVKYE